MAGMGVGIGAFMDGFSGGARIRQGMDDRAYQRQKDAQDREDFLFSRQRQVQMQDEALKNQRDDRKWTNDQRDRQRKTWQDDDNIKDQYKQGVTDAETARAADVEKNVQPIEAQGPTLDGKALPAWKVGDQTFTDQNEAKATSEKAVKPVMDYYMKNSAPKMVQSLIAAGRPDQAKAFQQWIETDATKRGMASWAQALHAATRGDPDAFAKHITDAYNTDGYFDDGHKASAKLLKDKDGNVTGMDLTITDPHGRQTTQTFNGVEEIYRMGTQFMAPENVFKYGMGQIEEADKQRAEIAKEKRAQAFRLETDTNKALLNQAIEEAKKQGPAAYDALIKRLNAAMGALGANDPTYARLPDDEKAARAMSYLAEQDKAAKAGLQGSVPNGPQINTPLAGAMQASPPAGRSIPMWMPSQQQ